MRYKGAGCFSTSSSSSTGPISRTTTFLSWGSFVSTTAATDCLRDLLGPTSPKVNYQIPSRLRPLVDYVSGWSPRDASTISRRVAPLNIPNASAFTTPDLLRRVYNINQTRVLTQKADFGVFEFAAESFAPADLLQYQQEFNLLETKVAHVVGPNVPSLPSLEGSLDVQQLLSIAQNAKLTYWIDKSQHDMEPFVHWIEYIVGEKSPPLVQSMSYGVSERFEQKTPLQRFNVEICKAGLRGITVLVASGDDGVASEHARNDPVGCSFQPSFPATSPYVLAVGATQGPPQGKPEVAASSVTGGYITTGGGFSLSFPRPEYQNAAVTKYLKTAPELPPLSEFPSKNRAYPDVALLGVRYKIIYRNETLWGFGTSASTPVMAGMLTLINGERMTRGLPPLGFVNPRLYSDAAQRASVFHDITVGRNNCCADVGPRITCCKQGFNATIGYDPLTGLGSVDYRNLLTFLSSHSSS